MTVIDPIADMLTRIRNAVTAGHTLVAMPSSKLKIEIAKIMKDEGYLEGFDVAEREDSPQKVLRLKNKQRDKRRDRLPFKKKNFFNDTATTEIYTKKQDIPWVLSG